MSSVAKAHLQFGGARRLRPWIMHVKIETEMNKQKLTLKFERDVVIHSKK